MAPASRLEKRREQLVGGVLYPAVVGAGLIGLATQAAATGWCVLAAPETQLAILAVVFFAGSAVPPEPDDARYPVRAFVYDIVEMCAMFAVFFLLSLFKAPGECKDLAERVEPWKVVAAFLLLAAVILAQGFWDRWVAHPDDKWWRFDQGLFEWPLRGPLVLLLIVDLVFVRHRGAALISVLHVLVLVVMTFLMGWYLVGEGQGRAAGAAKAPVSK